MNTLKCVGVVVYTLWYLIFIECENLAYNDKVGYAISDRKLCLNNCVAGQCIVDTSWKQNQCTNSDQDAPVYQLFKKNANCLSRCVVDSNSWCYTDNSGNWDYCNPIENETWIRKQKFTDSTGPCKNNCVFYYSTGNKDYYTCYHYWKSWDYCDPKYSYDYILGMTYGGYPCIGQCKNHDNTSYRWCYYYDSFFGPKWDYCAMPALPRPHDWSAELDQLFTVTEPFSVRIPIDRCKRDLTDNTPESRVRMPTNNLNNLASDLENLHNSDPRYKTTNMDSNHAPDNPIYRYTTETGDPALGSPVIPRVVRAKLLPRHLKSTKDRGNIPKKVHDNLDKMGKQPGDHAGHLVAFTLSGPSGPEALYNFIPQMGGLNIGDYASQEGFIRGFLRDNAHDDVYVDMLIIPMYKEGETRPRGIAMHVRYYRRNALVDQFYEYLPNYPNYGVTSTKSPFSSPPPPTGFGSLLPAFSIAGC